MPERIRAFMAILLPPALKDAAARRQEGLQSLFPAGSVRWVASENFHLTVRFFGDLDRKALDKAGSVVEGVDRSFAPITVRLGAISAFPSPARPQTLWIEVVDGEGRLEALAAQLDRKIREAGFGPADKPWRSHLTLGRAGRDRSLRPPEDWTRGLTEGAQDFTIGSVALMQSELRPQGPRYTPLRTASALPAV